MFDSVSASQEHGRQVKLDSSRLCQDHTLCALARGGWGTGCCTLTSKGTRPSKCTGCTLLQA